MNYERLNEERSEEESKRIHAMHQAIATKLLGMIAKETEKATGRTTSEDFEAVIALMKTDYLMVMVDKLPPEEYAKLIDQFSWCTVGIMAPFTDRMGLINVVNRSHDEWEAKQNEE